MGNQENQQEPTKSSNPTMWIILIIVIILLGIGAYFLFTQDSITNTNNVNTPVNTNTDINENVNTGTNNNTTNTNVNTSGWEIYENTEYGFRVQYPENWSLTESAVDREEFKYQSFGFNPGSDAGYQINIYSSLADLANGGLYSSLSEWIAAQETGPYSYPKTDFLGNDTYEGYWPSADTTYSFYIENDNKIYNIDMNWIYPTTRETNSITGRPEFSTDEEAFLKSFELL